MSLIFNLVFATVLVIAYWSVKVKEAEEAINKDREN